MSRALSRRTFLRRALGAAGIAAMVPAVPGPSPSRRIQRVAKEPELVGFFAHQTAGAAIGLAGSALLRADFS